MRFILKWTARYFAEAPPNQTAVSLFSDAAAAPAVHRRLSLSSVSRLEQDKTERPQRSSTTGKLETELDTYSLTQYFYHIYFELHQPGDETKMIQL